MSMLPTSTAATPSSSHNEPCSAKELGATPPNSLSVSTGGAPVSATMMGEASTLVTTGPTLSPGTVIRNGTPSTSYHNYS